MSKITNPKEKKRLSLTRDRRNVFHENSKASRKNIAKGKQRRHMGERRATSQLLGRLNGLIDDDTADATELDVKLTIADSRNRGFRKTPDRPLGEVLQDKKELREFLGAADK